MESNTSQRFKEFNIVQRAFLGALMSTLFTGVLGCDPPQNHRDFPVAKVTNLSEKVSTCEKKIRAQMENKILRLIPVSDWNSLILSANQLIRSTNKSEYYVNLSRDQVQGLSARHTTKSKAMNTEVRYSLTQATDNASASLFLEISVTSQQPKSKMSVEQILNISENCEISVNKTTLTKVKNTAADSYTFSEDIIFANNEKEHFTDSFTLATGQQLLDLALNLDKPSDATSVMYNYAKEVGLITISAQPNNTVKMTEFNMDLSLETYKIDYSAKGQVFITGYAGIDKALGITLSQNKSGNKWGVPKRLWRDNHLSESKDLNSIITVELSKDYFDDHNSIELQTEKKLTYDHFPAYWSVKELPTSNDKKLKTFQLIENAEASIADVATPADLASNDTIQTELPEIQAIIQPILAEGKDDRRLQIQLALNYLTENYPYDKSMIAGNSVRPLTTKQALDRGTGVCQHFAVIFTAMARAMKIPTRVVVGYLLSKGTAGLHAWVEVEITAGVWRVLDPQSSNSLTNLRTRNYLPLRRGGTLEDRLDKSEHLKMLSFFTSQSYIIKASQ